MRAIASRLRAIERAIERRGRGAGMNDVEIVWTEYDPATGEIVCCGETRTPAEWAQLKALGQVGELKWSETLHEQDRAAPGGA